MDREASQGELLLMLRDIHRYTRFVYGFFVVYAMLLVQVWSSRSCPGSARSRSWAVRLSHQRTKARGRNLRCGCLERREPR